MSSKRYETMSEGWRNILLPFSLAYGGIVSVRNFGYDSGLLGVKKLPAPVISVGNITVGGSGKTPFVMYLVGKLLLLGKKPAILSRGYKRMTDDLVIACPECGYVPDVQVIGDEPALISRKFPQVPVAVHADRHRAGMAVLQQFGADVFVLDDGMQNRELHRDIDFVLLKHSLYDLSDSYLPAGNLRDSKRRIKQADVIILTAHTRVSDDGEYSEVQRRYPEIPVAGINFVASELLDRAGSLVSLDILRNKDVVAFCGIANAEQFFENVDNIAGKAVSRKTFRDHHWYDEYDIDEIFGGNEDRIAVTTSKDAVRIFSDEELSQINEIRQIYALDEKAVVDFGEEHIDGALNRVFRRVYA